MVTYLRKMKLARELLKWKKKRQSPILKLKLELLLITYNMYFKLFYILNDLVNNFCYDVTLLICGVLISTQTN